MSLFNEPNIERKNCVQTATYERLLGMCIVQHVEVKSVFTFQPINVWFLRVKKVQNLLQRFENSF